MTNSVSHPCTHSFTLEVSWQWASSELLCLKNLPRIVNWNKSSFEQNLPEVDSLSIYLADSEQAATSFMASKLLQMKCKANIHFNMLNSACASFYTSLPSPLEMSKKWSGSEQAASF